VKSLVLLLALAACGDNQPAPLTYKNPPAGGKLRLVKNAATTADSVVLDLVVGKDPLTGYSVGFDLPLDDARVSLAGFTPGTALDPGPAPIAAMAALPVDGPLAHMLVTAQSQKATAHDGNATLAPGPVVYTLTLDLVQHAPGGVVFDGTATGFTLPSGGMRDRTGNAVVEPAEIAIGKLVVNR
jgi:hypothetical protein